MILATTKGVQTFQDKKFKRAVRAIDEAAGGDAMVAVKDLGMKTNPPRPLLPDARKYVDQVRIKRIELSKDRLEVRRLLEILRAIAKAGYPTARGGRVKLVCYQRDGRDRYVVYNGNHRTLVLRLLGGKGQKIEAEVWDAP